MNYYVTQQKGYGIGNFINCTPALQIVSKHFKNPVKVVFYDKHVEEMFLDCPFITISNSRDVAGHQVLFSSANINYVIPDWHHIYNLALAKLKINRENLVIPHTYVDECPVPTWVDKEYVVVFRGMINDNWRQAKDPGDETYRNILGAVSSKYQVVFPCSSDDFKRFINYMKDWFPSKVVVDNIRESLGLIKGAKFIISNDTGMYHASAALKKPTFVIWKDTKFMKNKAPGDTCTYSFKGSWEKDFDKWMTQHNYLTTCS
jgi:hypothetical protein